ncbi:MAG: hypothetical protein RRZ68_07545 [Oscillospiraceae bacterium]
MKKIITTILAMSVLVAMSTTAFAADINQGTTLPTNKGTAITYTVAPTYTVTIPESITLNKKTTGTAVSYTGSGEISTGNNVRLKNKECINITLASDFVMDSAEGATEDYQIFLGNTVAPLTNNAVVAEFGTLETQQTTTLNYLAGDPHYAGTYSDTVTFTISIATKGGK